MYGIYDAKNEQDLLLRICCINYVISLFGIWYHKNDKDYQFCKFILKSANVDCHQNINHLSDLMDKTRNSAQKCQFPFDSNLLQSLDFQLIGMDCNKLLAKKENNNDCLILFIKWYLGKIFIIGKIMTMYVTPVLFGCYVALLEMDKSFAVVGTYWCWICLVFNSIILFVFYHKYNKDKKLFCIFPFSSIGMLPCEFYSFSLVQNHYNNIQKCIIIRQIIQSIFGTDVTIVIEQYMQLFHHFCQKQDTIQS